MSKDRDLRESERKAADSDDDAATIRHQLNNLRHGNMQAVRLFLIQELTGLDDPFYLSRISSSPIYKYNAWPLLLEAFNIEFLREPTLLMMAHLGDNNLRAPLEARALSLITPAYDAEEQLILATIASLGNTEVLDLLNEHLAQMDSLTLRIILLANKRYPSKKRLKEVTDFIILSARRGESYKINDFLATLIWPFAKTDPEIVIPHIIRLLDARIQVTGHIEILKDLGAKEAIPSLIRAAVYFQEAGEYQVGQEEAIQALKDMGWEHSKELIFQDFAAVYVNDTHYNSYDGAREYIVDRWVNLLAEIPDVRAIEALDYISETCDSYDVKSEALAASAKLSELL